MVAQHARALARVVDGLGRGQLVDAGELHQVADDRRVGGRDQRRQGRVDRERVQGEAGSGRDGGRLLPRAGVAGSASRSSAGRGAGRTRTRLRRCRMTRPSTVCSDEPPDARAPRGAGSSGCRCRPRAATPCRRRRRRRSHRRRAAAARRCSATNVSSIALTRPGQTLVDGVDQQSGCSSPGCRWATGAIFGACDLRVRRGAGARLRGATRPVRAASGVVRSRLRGRADSTIRPPETTRIRSERWISPGSWEMTIVVLPRMSSAQRVDDDLGRLGVQAGGRLVEDQQRGAPDEGPGDRESLPLAAGQGRAALAERGLVARRAAP